MTRIERQPDWPSLKHRSKFVICPLAPKDVRAEEAHVRRRISRRLTREREVSFAVYNVSRPVLDNALMTAKLASWQYTHGMTVQRIVGARLIRDYRSSMESLFSGYMVQAATVASALLESAVAVRFIGRSEERERAWFLHRNPVRLPWNLKDMCAELHPEHPEIRQWYLDSYKHLCLLKHGNPLRSDADFDDPTVFDDDVRVNAGPNGSPEEDLERRVIFAVTSYHLLRAFMVIAGSFQKYHNIAAPRARQIGLVLHWILHYVENNVGVKVTH